MGQFLYFVIDKGYIRRIDCDVTSNPAHCNSHIRFFQCRSIIYPIANHTDPFSPFLIGVNPFQLILWQAVCVHFLNVKLPCYGVGGFYLISRQKDRPNAECSQLMDDLTTLRSKGIGEDKIANQRLANRDIYHRTTLLKMLLCLQKDPIR